MNARLERLWQLAPGSRTVSRWQTSRSFPQGTLFCREDELGGYKARKYSTLIPALRQRGVREVVLKGSSHSNNLLQLALRLKQEGIRPYYCLEGRPGPPRGNGLFSRLVMGRDFEAAPESVVGLPVIAEGASCRESLPGALTLAASLGQNWASCASPPDTVFIEAGTGFSAAALILGIGYLGLPLDVKVVWLGDAAGGLESVVMTWLPAARELLGEDWSLPCFEILRPPTARSFGSVNRRILEEVIRMARQEGILVDPIYTAKLTLTARAWLSQSQGRRALVYCGGGAFELCGFQEQLAALCDESQRTDRDTDILLA